MEYPEKWIRLSTCEHNKGIRCIIRVHNAYTADEAWHVPQSSVITSRIDSGNGKAPLGNKPLPERRLSQNYVEIKRH